MGRGGGIWKRMKRFQGCKGNPRTASDDIAKQAKGIRESGVTPSGLHYDAMHNATCVCSSYIIHSNGRKGYDSEKDFHCVRLPGLPILLLVYSDKGDS